MYLLVEPEGVTLAEPAVFTAFSVRSAVGGSDVVLEALGPDGEATPEADHVFVSIAAVRRLAGSVVDAEWEAGLAKMVDYAGSNGWLNQAGDAIKAHIEPDPTA